MHLLLELLLVSARPHVCFSLQLICLVIIHIFQKYVNTYLIILFEYKQEVPIEFMKFGCRFIILKLAVVAFPL